MVLRGLNDLINRRNKVETMLWDMWRGKRPLPTKDECREMALLLGVPTKKRMPKKETT